MPVSVNPVSRAPDDTAQVLGAAIGIARDIYKVKMDNKALDAANKLKAETADKEASDLDRKESLAFAEKFEIVDPKAKGAIDVAAAGLQLPRGINLPQGMAIRPRSVSENEAKLAADYRSKQLLAEQKAPPQTMGQRALDTSFALDFNDWETTGKSTVQKNLGLLNEAIATLEERQNDLIGTSGRFTGNLPDFARSEESVRLRDDVHRAAQATLRATLGPAFTEKEGERIMNASYNEKLSPAENIKKIRSTINELVQNANNMEQRARFFEENGTLSGYRSGGGSAVAEDKGPSLEELMAEKARRQKTGTAQK
jgi:hypothetical protein